MMADILYGQQAEKKIYTLPKPVWSNDVIPEKEREKIEAHAAVKGKYVPASYGIEFVGRDLDVEGVREAVHVLTEASRKLYTSGNIAFFQYGDKERQVILPLRPASGMGSDPLDARERNEAVIRRATSDFTEKKLPRIDIPNGNIFLEK